MNAEPAAESTNARLLDYLRLLRIPNVFTAWSDVLMGFLVTHQTLWPAAPLVGLMLSSSMLYLAGMALNDVFDIEVDRRERPERPLPSGRIPLSRARWIGLGLLAGGVLIGGATGWLAVGTFPAWRPGLIAVAIAVCVLGYDGGLKRTPAGPYVMGACRFFNVLLGMSLVGEGQWSLEILGYGTPHLLAAAGIGIYIVGVTWLARNEAGESPTWLLVAATLVMMAGIATLGFVFRQLPPAARFPGIQEWLGWGLLGLLAFSILRRCNMAFFDPTPRQVQLAVKYSILSLIALDAIITMLTAGPAYSLGVLALLIPTMVLGKWVYST